jgi:hypothetical protein
MAYRICRVGALFLPALFFLHTASASDIPRVTFEQLTDNSEIIATGNITRTWTDWDPDHKYIWTHFELAVSAVHKGTEVRTIDIAEPGGSLNGIVMSISGATGYNVGDHVLVFLTRMPNGYLRTSGFGQGRYVVDSGGRLHGDVALKAGDPGAASTVRSLNGMTVNQVAQLVSARVRVFGGVR